MLSGSPANMALVEALVLTSLLVCAYSSDWHQMNVTENYPDDHEIDEISSYEVKEWDVDYSRLWMTHEVPYILAKNLTSEEKRQIKEGMMTWQKNTCLTFRPKRPGDKNWIRISSGKGCSSALGMQGGEQHMFLQRRICFSKGTILHEIGHALGLAHEHQHPDRDSQITIVKENVRDSAKFWFSKHMRGDKNIVGDEYDMDSVMHYNGYAFSGNRKRTMKSKDPTLQDRLDNYYKPLSFSDIAVINRRHKCWERCPKKVKCHRSGYVDHNCQCQTPQAYFHRTCRDIGHPDWCLRQFSQNMCTDRKVAESCTRTCDHCAMYKMKRKKLTGDCENKYYDDRLCDQWAREGRCRQYPQFLPRICEKSCQMCRTVIVRPPCEDLNENCPTYPRTWCKPGGRYYSFMTKKCRKFCSFCW